ncbi:MAG: hypothetical protein ACR2NP_02245 [Pirellulaceae bacterium]
MIKLRFVLPTSLTVCLVSAVAACAQDMPSLLIGNWKADVERTIEAMQEAGSPQDPEMAKQVLPGAAVFFSEDGKLSMTMEMGGIEHETLATYQVASTDEATRTIRITVKMDEMPDQSNSAEVTLLSDDMIRLATDDGNVLVLNRVEASEGD